MPDDYTRDRSTRGYVAVGGTATGVIETGNDWDWFRVELVAGRTYTIDLEGDDTGGGTLDSTVLRGLYDSDGRRISGTQTNGGGEGDNARLEFTPAESGSYYISARGYRMQTGSYTVRVTQTDAPPDFAETSYTFELAENADGSTDRVALGTVSATDPEASTVTYGIEGGNDAGLFEVDSATGELFYTGTGEDYESGTTGHELTVRASDGNLHADVAVNVTVTDVAEDDYPRNRSTEGYVPVGGTATGVIETGNDWDWFRVELVAGRTYTIDLEGDDTGGGTLDSTVLRGLYDSDGRRISGTQTNGGGEGDNARLEFTPAESGSYYISARGYRMQTGSYTVRVTQTDAPPDFAETSYTFELAENADGSTDRVALGTVSATDPEASTVTYGIEGGNDAGLFEVDSATGELFYTGTGEDYESGTTGHELTIRASDGNLHADVAVNVTVTETVQVTPRPTSPTVTGTPIGNPDVSQPEWIQIGILDYSHPRWLLKSFDYGMLWAGWGFGLGGSQRGAPEEIVIAEVDGVTALRFNPANRTSAWYDRNPGAADHPVHGERDWEIQDDFFFPRLAWTAGDDPYLIAQVYLGSSRSSDYTSLRMPALYENSSGGEARTWPGIFYRDGLLQIRGPGRGDIAVTPSGHEGKGWVTLGMTVDDHGDITYVGRYGTHSLAELFGHPDFEYRNSDISREHDRSYFPLTHSGNTVGMFSQHISDDSVNAIAYIEYGKNLVVDNDSIPDGATQLGDITQLNGPRFPHGKVNGDSDVMDYYSFTLSEPRNVLLGLRRLDAAADLVLENAEGNVLASGTEAGTMDERIRKTLEAGEYYVRVEAREPGHNAYVFRYGVTAVDEGAGTTDNHTLGIAEDVM